MLHSSEGSGGCGGGGGHGGGDGHGYDGVGVLDMCFSAILCAGLLYATYKTAY